MPGTALAHFKEDIRRARAIVAHSDPLPQTTDTERMLRSDLLRSACMFAVGALDAYFCDAYTDVVAATIISKSRHPAMTLPDFFEKIEFPVKSILESYARNTNWRWRMAARKMMARENVLKLDRIQSLFNSFFRDGHRLYGDVMDAWIVHPNARKRMFSRFSPAAADGPIGPTEEGRNSGHSSLNSTATARKPLGSRRPSRNSGATACPRPGRWPGSSNSAKENRRRFPPGRTDLRPELRRGDGKSHVR